MRTAPKVPVDTTLADARESYAYWRARRSKLPWHRRAARREAHSLAARWRARLVRAHLDRLGLGIPAEPVISLLGRTRRDHARWLWRTVGRSSPLASRKLWLAVAIMGVAMLALTVVVTQAALDLLF